MKALSLSCALLSLAAFPAAAQIQSADIAAAAKSRQASSVTVIQGSESLALVCAADARRMADGQMGMIEAIAPCTVAIDTEPLNRRDLASTYVNRGVIQLIAGEAEGAESDLNKAAEIEPDLGEAYVNRGSLMIQRKQYAEGVSDIDHGLALGAKEPERAYYNRGIALEHLGDVRGAYESYRKAAELKPSWTPAQQELTRFTVAPAR